MVRTSCEATRRKKIAMQGALLLLTVVFLCAGCALSQKPPQEPETMQWVDLTRYQGTWHEIARLPMWFQRGCVKSQATYTIIELGKIAVKNECTTSDGEYKKAEGYAYVVDEKSNAKLEVVFDNWFSRLFLSLAKGKYWILYVDDEYQSAIVGTPDRKYLWILARTQKIDEAIYQELIRYCQKLGFKTEGLIRAS